MYSSIMLIFVSPDTVRGRVSYFSILVSLLLLMWMKATQWAVQGPLWGLPHRVGYIHSGSLWILKGGVLFLGWVPFISLLCLKSLSLPAVSKHRLNTRWLPGLPSDLQYKAGADSQIKCADSLSCCWKLMLKYTDNEITDGIMCLQKEEAADMVVENYWSLRHVHCMFWRTINPIMYWGTLLIDQFIKLWITENHKIQSLTFMSSKFKEFRLWLFLFHSIGGLACPMMVQINTALWPTVTVVILTFWSSGRVSRYTSVGKKKDVSYHGLMAWFLLWYGLSAVWVTSSHLKLLQVDSH